LRLREWAETHGKRRDETMIGRGICEMPGWEIHPEKRLVGKWRLAVGKEEVPEDPSLSQSSEEG